MQEYADDMRLYLEHGLLVFAVFHLSRGEVEDTPLHRVLVAVVDEDVGPTHNYKVLHPRVGARLHEAQEAFLRYYRSGIGREENERERRVQIFCLFSCR